MSRAGRPAWMGWSGRVVSWWILVLVGGAGWAGTPGLGGGGPRAASLPRAVPTDFPWRPSRPKSAFTPCYGNPRERLRGNASPLHRDLATPVSQAQGPAGCGIGPPAGRHISLAGSEAAAARPGFVPRVRALEHFEQKLRDSFSPVARRFSCLSCLLLLKRMSRSDLSVCKPGSMRLRS